MSRTFTLQRLLLNVTLLAVVLAIISAFPTQSVRVGLFIAAFVPAILISVLFAYFTPRPKQTLAIAALGACLGWLLTPRIMVRSITWWDAYLQALQMEVLATVIGAALFGSLAFWFARRQRPKAPSRT